MAELRFPLTEAAAGIWYAHHLTESPLYNTAEYLHIQAPIDSNLLLQAADATIESAVGLHIQCSEKAGSLFQTIPSSVQFHSQQITCSTDEAFQHMQEDVETLLDLTKDNYVRAILFSVSSEEHFLYLRIHHLVSDAYSFRLLFQQISERYSALLHHETFTKQFGDYVQMVEQEVQYKTSDKATADAAYWLSKMQGTEVISLSRKKSGRMGQIILHPSSLSSATWAKLETYSKQLHVNIQEVITAVVIAYTKRMTQAEDIIVGIPMMNRFGHKSLSVPSTRVNVLPLRVTFTSEETFEQLCINVKSFMTELKQHQMYRQEQLRRDLRLTTDGQLYGPEINFMPFYENYLFGNVEVEHKKIVTGPVEDISFNFYNTPHGMQFDLVANSDLYDQAEVERHAARFLQLLELLVDQADIPLFNLPLLLQEEAAIFEAKQGPASELKNATVYELFKKQMEHMPGATAVQMNDTPISYAELDLLVGRIAHQLKAHDIGLEDFVGICMERSIEMVATMLACFKVGAAYIPMDPTYPTERLLYMIQDARPKIVLVNSEVSFNEEGTPIVPLQPSKQIYEPIAPCIGQTAYMIYTSGSTGNPKGVVVEMPGLVNFLQAMQRQFSLCEEDNLLAITTISFDISALELYLPLLYGASIHLATKEQVQDPVMMQSLIQQQNISIIQATPTVWQMMVQYAKDALNGLTLLVGGEALSKSLALALLEAGATVHNMYGPTETTIWSTYTEVRPQDAPSLGTAIDRTDIYVLDAMLQPVPIGVVGELYIAGDGLARCYHNRPSLTAERFVAHPFAAGKRIYRTGDLVVWQEDGSLHYVSRADHQVKIRGFRIELGEIENALEEMTSIEQAVVMIREDQPGHKQIVAYVVGNETEQQCRLQLGERLPDYMIPAHFVFMEAFPLTNNGKVDRKMLPQPHVLNIEKAKPTTRTEETICAFFEDILNLPSVGIDENFFQLGGHSLLATELLLTLRKTFAIDLSISVIFNRPTVKELAQAVDKANKKNLAVIDRQQVERIPLSHAQRSLWFIQQLEQSSASYNIPLVYTIEQPIDELKLIKSIGKVAEKHTILRTIYPAVDGVPYQLIIEDAPKVLIEEVNPEEVPSQINACTRYAFDLKQEPGFRVTLINTNTLVVVFHHISADGWSLATFTEDLQLAYDGHELEPLTIQYHDFAVWQQTHGVYTDDNLAYWTEKLKHVPDEIELVRDGKRQLQSKPTSETLTFTIDSALHGQLEQLAKDEQATLYMVLQSGFLALMTKLGAGEDLILGSPIAGRDQEELLANVGMFINTVAMRTDISGDPRFTALLERVKQTSIEAMEHQYVPFDHIVEALKPTRVPSQHPIFQIMFALQNTPQPSLVMEDQNADIQLHTVGQPKFDLNIEMREEYLAEQPNGIEVHVEYRMDLYEAETVAALMERYVIVLQQVLNNPAISELNVLLEQEQEKILLDWNPKGHVSEQKTIAEQFEAIVEMHPERIAVSDENEVLTYIDLNRKANQLAFLLLEKGVTSETFVALLMPRSTDMIVSILAVLKTGAAYVPIDPVYPQDRIDYILNDSNPSCLITTEDLKPTAEATAAMEVLVMEELSLTSFPAENSDHNNHPMNPAYVIYTSGSTGRPKGVVIPNQNVIRLLDATDEWFHFNEEDRWSLFHSYAFDFSVWEIWGALLYGGELVIIPYNVSRSPFDFLALLADKKITVLNQTPSAFYQLMTVDKEHPELSEQLALRSIVFGGEALNLTRLQEWYDRHPANAPTLVNMYGITETTVHVSYLSLNEELSQSQANSLIGTAIPDLNIYVLDEQLKLLPPGVVGEMYVSGEGLAQGYLNRASLTAERFIANPYGAPGSRMYRTGDLARWTQNGELDYIGRIDHQVKIRGFRIELGEIEQVLLKHPQIAQAAVIAREDRKEDVRLAAYYVPEQGTDATEQMLKDFVSRSLPAYMVPSSCTCLEQMPLTANGKLDTKQLPAPVITLQELLLPKTPQETLLCELFCDVLNLPQVGTEDSFFELGGHSLLAVQLIGRIREAFGKELAIGHLFEAPTVSGLAQILQKGKESQALNTVLPLRSGEQPIFAVHPAGGLSWCYAGLLKNLSPEFALYGIQAKGIAEDCKLPRSLTEMALGYIEAIKEIQPNGPYRLLGWSLGGNVVQEMAVQLERQGEELSLLCIMDAYPFTFTPPVELTEEQEALVALLALAGYEPDIEDEVTQEYVMNALKAEGSAIATLDESTILRLKEVYKNSIQLLKNHQHQTYDGDALFYKSTLVPDWIPDVDVTSWKPYIKGELTQIDIACRHKDMCQSIPLNEIGQTLIKYLVKEKKMYV
ncbi:nonribosomal peptide synthetase DhbF [Solibacillus kalamii]|uniref:Non-ribosomal peptide synthetase n=1 Tax=Solibacillus kalamii TaxID=1748298 RepID=A0ABX3ZC71_9BACL|nr:non-ribosomal peptide synthetase [Solibacillus kalamii]MBM7667243.1 nonribosomal peptide synthetase DhbF [Solibacillus kalamii]OUZ37338.1 non-ribosomal peptide synthetase [Solibacillus kalamii]